MKIVLIGNYGPDRSMSMGRYALMLQRHLAERGHSVRLICPPAILGKATFLPGAAKKWIYYIDKFIFGPFFLRAECRDADVVHVCDHSNSMYLSCAGRKAQILTCHDLLAVDSARGLYPGVGVGATGRIFQRWIASGIRSAKNLICVSERTKEDVLRLAPDFSGSIRVIHHPLNTSYRPAGADEVARVLASFGLAADTEYLFHIGGNQWYKNRLGVLKIFAEMKRLPRFARTKLVMAGRPWTDEIRAFARSAFPEGEVFERVNVSDGDLQALYSGALALLFASREEGFGWPILEAQACGCPVITTNRGPMTEVAGDAALLIDCDHPEKAAGEILEGLPRLQQLREKGFVNLQRFTADRAMNAYAEAYEAVLAASRGTAAGDGSSAWQEASGSGNEHRDSRA